MSSYISSSGHQMTQRSLVDRKGQSNRTSAAHSKMQKSADDRIGGKTGKTMRFKSKRLDLYQGEGPKEAQARRLSIGERSSMVEGDTGNSDDDDDEEEGGETSSNQGELKTEMIDMYKAF